MAEIQGLAELRRKLKELKGLAENKKALLAGAYTLQRYAQENAPVKTGFLRNSAESVETENGAELRFNAEYAYPVEMGHGNVPPNGFVRRAIDEHSDEIVSAVAKELENQIKGIAK